MLHAAWAVAALERPIRHIVRELQVSSAQSLYYVFKRYAERTPAAVRASGGFPFVLNTFEAELARSKPAPAGRVRDIRHP
ncbi:MAG: hypothetical protein IRY91_15765 [Gemmatimonadaceae bacterium]|nr:hypothetical protein [Gemmatimonadaceae bacterium]